MKAVILASLLITFKLHAAPYEINVPDETRMPMFLIEKNNYSGIYLDVFKKVLENAKIDYKFEPLPMQRRRKFFEEGKSYIDCCPSPNWRKSDAEAAVQLFSDPLFNSDDLYIFPKGKAFKVPNIDILGQKKVAIIRGYGYKGMAIFKDKAMQLNSEDELIGFIEKGRADVGIVNGFVLNYWLKTHPNTQLDVGEIHESTSLHIRIHKAKKELLPSINQAITKLKGSGEIDQILKKYMSKS